MAIHVSCQMCGKGLNVPGSAAGRNVRCPDCSASIPVPTGGASARHWTSKDRQRVALLVGLLAIVVIPIIIALMR
jgi:hypothetical protein